MLQLYIAVIDIFNVFELSVQLLDPASSLIPDKSQLILDIAH